MTIPAPAPDPVDAEFLSALSSACHDLDLTLAEEDLNLCRRHFERVLQTNRHTNLTRITSPIEAAVKHYADSLAILPWARRTVPGQATVLDVGSGAGFPAVPLAIGRRDWTVMAIDGTRKKADFLAQVAAELGLPNLTARHARARELGGKIEPFDVVIFRAVGDPIENLREARRLVAAGGWLVCYTTPGVMKAMQPAHYRQAERLGFAAPQSYAYQLNFAGEPLLRTLAIWPRCGNPSSEARPEPPTGAEP